MAQGFAFPVRAHRGKIVLESGEAENGKIILLGCSPGDSANPFEDLGLDAPIFALNDTAAQALIGRRIDRLFARLQAAERARKKSVSFSQRADELEVSITYIDLETDEEQEVTRSITRQV